MLSGTTQIYLAKLVDIDVAQVDTIIFTFKGYGTVQKVYPNEIGYTKESDLYSIPLTQQDTTVLTNPVLDTTKVICEAQINYKSRAVSKQIVDEPILIDRSIATQFIDNNTPTDDIYVKFKMVDNVIVAYVEGNVDVDEVVAKVEEKLDVTQAVEDALDSKGYITADEVDEKLENLPSGDVEVDGTTISTTADGKLCVTEEYTEAINAEIERLDEKIDNLPIETVEADGTTITTDEDGKLCVSEEYTNSIKSEFSEVTDELADDIEELKNKPSGITVQYKNSIEADGVTSGGTSVYWDSIDNAWLYYTRRIPYDAEKKSNYYTLCKEKADRTRIYTKKPVFDGTDYPIKSGSMSVTDIKRWNDYYLVAVRSNEPNIPSDGVDNTSIWGYLLIFDLDLNIVANKPFNAKCSNVNVVSTRYILGETSCFICVSCQMSYFQIFKLQVTDDTVTITDRAKTYFKAFEGTSYTDIHTEITEFQNAKYYQSADNSKKLLISAGFGDGVHIVDFSDITKTGKYTSITSYRWDEHDDIMRQDYSEVGISSKYGSTFSVDVTYPYVYATFAQSTEVIKAYNDGLGDCRVQAFLVLDISDLSDIKSVLYKIPHEFCQTDVTGDPKPCSIKKFENSVYLGLGDKGVAKFDVDGLNAEYKGNIKVGKMKCIRYIAINPSGEMYCRNLSETGAEESTEYEGTQKYNSTIVDLTSIEQHELH